MRSLILLPPFSVGTIVTANADNSIRLFDVRNLELIERIECHSDIVTSVSCSSGEQARGWHNERVRSNQLVIDYTYILTASRDGTLRVTDTRTSSPLYTYSYVRSLVDIIHSYMG